jgi:hypothetical protein
LQNQIATRQNNLRQEAYVRYSIIFLLVALMTSFSFGDEPKPEVYSVTAVYTSGPAKTIQIKIYIRSYTPDEEVVQLATILKNEGPDALLKAIKKVERGRLAPVRKTGTDVGVVRIRPTEKGTRISMLMERPIGFVELYRGMRTEDYPFGILQMEIGPDGKGEGALILAAKITFTKDNQIEVENYGIQPLRLMGVSKLD